MAEFATMSDEDANALLAVARGLQNPARVGMRHRLLQGKNLALMCDASDPSDGAAAGAVASATLFQRAASALGAHVAQLRPILTQHSTRDQVEHTARLLGRLYDALECVGMPPDLVGRISAVAGVPVFEAISSPDHPTSRLAGRLGRLGDGTAPDDNRCALIQAVLISVLA